MFKLNNAQVKDEKGNRLFEKGDYGFEVISAESKTSTKSSDGKMIALKLRVFDGERKTVVKDWLGQWTGGATKMKTFLEAVGLDIEEGFTPIELVGLAGTVSIKKGEFRDEPINQVAWYIPLTQDNKFVKPTASAPVNMVEDDDIPF